MADEQESVFDPKSQSVSGWLRDLRAARGITQAELASRMGISQAEVSRMERRKDLRVSTIRRAVEALGGKLEVRLTQGSDFVVLKKFSSE